MSKSIKKDLAKKAAVKKIKAVTNSKCLCGCGSVPSKKGSRFKPGHDMKLRSKLLKTSRDGKNSSQRVKATATLRSYGWA